MFITTKYKEGYIHSSICDGQDTILAVFSYEYLGSIHCMKTTCKTMVSAKAWISSQMKRADNVAGPA